MSLPCNFVEAIETLDGLRSIHDSGYVMTITILAYYFSELLEVGVPSCPVI